MMRGRRGGGEAEVIFAEFGRMPIKTALLGYLPAGPRSKINEIYDYFRLLLSYIWLAV